MKWVQVASVGAIAVAAACQNIHSAPIDDEETKPDAAADVGVDAPVEASACKTDVAPATCGHDPTIPLRDAGSDADTDADADVDADIDAAPPSELPPPPACTIGEDPLCCADEYAVSCSASIVPSGCRMLPPNPSGLFLTYCCACR